MSERANVFAIHSWDEADLCRRLEELLRGVDPGLAHYSLLPERALDGSPEEIARKIVHRISMATAVLVVNSSGLHRRSTAGFEMAIAVQKRKRIVVVQPQGAFDQPIPQVLDGHVYRFATWRSDVVGRAIRGEYPQDDRIFDIAEVADRRRLVGILSAGVAAVSFAVIVTNAAALQSLHRELAAQGVDLRWDGQIAGAIIGRSLLGAGIGGLLGALSGDARTALFATAAGASVGAAVGIHSVYRARVLGSTTLRILTIDPV